MDGADFQTLENDLENVLENVQLSVTSVPTGKLGHLKCHVFKCCLPSL